MGYRFDVMCGDYDDPQKIDEQTILFWNLQIQFMQSTPSEIIAGAGCLGFKLSTPTKVLDFEEYRNHYATELALKLSGLEE